MGEKINRDQNRFIEIVKGKIRKDLKKYFKPGKVVLPRKGGGNVAIPVPKIDLPTIRYGKNKGGVGQGPANPGTDLGPVSQEPGEGEDKQAGEGHGQDIYVEFSHEEILEMLAAELPRIQPKGQRMIASEKIKYTEIRKVGPKSLRHHKKTYRKALRRQIASGEYSADKPQVIPVKEDERFKSWQQIEEPRNNAVIIFMRDISGSVSDEEREIINYICFFSEIWLRNQYSELETAYIVHDTEARTVKDQEEFLSIDFGGGTMISTAHEEAIKLINECFPPHQWNIYIMYFSDGLNWGEDDNKVIKLLKEHLIPVVNQYAYGEIEVFRSWWRDSVKKSGNFSGPGHFGHSLAEEFNEEEKVVWAELTKADDALDAFKKFYGTGN